MDARKTQFLTFLTWETFGRPPRARRPGRSPNCCVVICAGAFGGSDVAYPAVYRNWTHVKSKAILKGHEQFDHFGEINDIYADDKALKAMRDCTAYPDGSVPILHFPEADITTTP